MWQIPQLARDGDFHLWYLRPVNSIDTRVARVFIAEDGIFEVQMHEGVSIGVPEITEVLDAQMELIRDTPRVLALIDARPVRSMTRAAQRETARPDIAARTDALAILIRSPVSRLLGNFFMAIIRADYPTRMFEDDVAARAWLLAHRDV